MLCRLRGDGGIPGGRVGWRCTITVVRAYVGVTDDNWYRFLADRPGVTEVNFWQPSGAREFRVLAPGEPFFFKTHYPHNKLVGGGFFSDSARLRVSEAWEFFGEANGVASIAGDAGADRPVPAGPDRARRGPGDRLPVRPRRPLLPGRRHRGPAAAVRPQHRAGQELRHGRPGGSGVFRGRPAADSRRRGGTGLPASPGTGPGRCSATRGWRRTGSASSPSRRSSWTPTTGAAPSAARTSRRSCRRPTSGRSPRAGSTGSTTGCCSGPMSTPCSTAGTSAWTRSTACWSARACGRTSATATSSTPRPGRSSTCRTPGRPARPRIPGVAPRRGLPQGSRNLIKR